MTAPISTPELLRLDDDIARVRLAELAQTAQIVDQAHEDVVELFRLDFPYIAPGTPEFDATMLRYADTYPQTAEALQRYGVWAYFPWRHTLVHLPPPEQFLRLRTARNLFLIEPDEQQIFYNSTVAIAGLSVGSAALQTLVLSGGAGRLHIADSDVLATVNLNRLPASVCELGIPKTTIAARRVHELNPFQQVSVWEQGVTDENVDAFLGGTQPVDLLVEEMDDLYMKVQARFVARSRRIPVVMATDNGDNAMVDVERFDLESDRPLFHGIVPDDILATVPQKANLAERVRVASQIVGLGITPRTQASMQLVGTQIPTWPQLGNAATLSGAAVSYVARRILTGVPMPSGRYHVSLDGSLEPGYHDPAAVALRAASTEEFAIGLTQIFGVRFA